MMPLNEMIVKNISSGMTRREAENYVCQEVVLSKISKSKYLEKVLIKGGVVMFNYTHNIRRTTNDLDFDFVRYDISNESLYSFINDLNLFEQSFLISIVSIEELHQDDYHGKRLWVTISDQKTKLKFKMDIGVHTLMMVEQDILAFVFLHDNESLTVKANPPEQIFAEKAYSLAKHGLLTERFKDVFDMYYLINNKNLNHKLIKDCLDLLTINGIYNLNSSIDVINKISDIFENQYFKDRLRLSKHKWLDDEDEVVLKSIIDYLYSL